MTTQQKAAHKAWKTRKGNMEVVAVSPLSPADKAWQTRRKNLQLSNAPLTKTEVKAFHKRIDSLDLTAARQTLKDFVNIAANLTD